MKKTKINCGYTEIIFVIDKSGSMSGLVKDTIGGYNTFIENQKKEQGNAVVTTALFDHNYDFICVGVDINDITPLTENDYKPCGMTALLDAVGKTIKTVDSRLCKTKNKPENVIFIIITDGEENSSCEFTYDVVKSLIEEKTNSNWKFLFLGAGLEVAENAVNIGISRSNISSYTGDSAGINSVYSTLSCAVSDVRNTGVLTESWSDGIIKE